MWSERGESIVAVLVASMLMSLVFLSLGTMLKFGMSMEKGVASNSDLSQTVDTLRLIFQRKETCSKSGLKGLRIDPARPDASPIVIHLPGETGVGPVYLSEGTSAGSRKVTRLRFTSLASAGATGPNRIFFATLSLATIVTGEAITHRKPDRDLYLSLILDASNRVADCFGEDIPKQIKCSTVSSGWIPLVNHQTYSVSCPADAQGSHCGFHYYDTNYGIIYHGYARGLFDADRKHCRISLNDGGISEGEVFADCCKLE